MLDRGDVRDYADLARLGYVTRARMTQIMKLTTLAPDIQEWLLFLPNTTGRRDAITERRLRRVAAPVMWEMQRAEWKQIFERPNV